MSDSTIFTFSLFTVALVGGLMLYLQHLRSVKKPLEEAANDFAAGLNYLVGGDRALALQKFREVVRRDTNNVDAYVKIGDILRDAGNLDRAAKVHRDLLVRTNLTNHQQLQILRSLAKDYDVAGKHELALNAVQKILAIHRSDLWALDLEMQLYERLKQWDKAYESCEALAKARGESRHAKLSYYLIQQGLQLAEHNSQKASRVKFREALKIDPLSPEAYLNLADSYMREERPEDALEALKKFIEKNPAKASVVFTRIKDILYAIGEFGEIENIYNSIIESYPENKDAQLALSEIYEKKGEINRAIQLCLDILEKDSKYKPARRMLVAYYHKKGDDRRAVDHALKYMSESA
jgi:lipopolysaccharide biosynthesis regulator YciM